jgi:hypothetical protein
LRMHAGSGRAKHWIKVTEGDGGVQIEEGTF